MSIIAFTDADRIVLKSYEHMLDGLAAYLGDGYEIILYSLEDPSRSIVKIINGQYTERHVGAPVSGLALSILEHIQQPGENNYVCYTTQNKLGETLKLSSIAIRGEKDNIIGLLCINHYQNTQPQDVLMDFFEDPKVLDVLRGEQATPAHTGSLRDTVLQTKQRIDDDPTVLPSLKNKEIVLALEEQGIFKLKNAVVSVAEILGISKNTVYLHLRNGAKH